MRNMKIFQDHKDAELKELRAVGFNMLIDFHYEVVRVQVVQGYSPKEALFMLENKKYLKQCAEDMTNTIIRHMIEHKKEFRG